jgi:hypothetical protein
VLNNQSFISSNLVNALSALWRGDGVGGGGDDGALETSYGPRGENGSIGSACKQLRK